MPTVLEKEFRIDEIHATGLAYRRDSPVFDIVGYFSAPPKTTDLRRESHMRLSQYELFGDEN